MHADGNKLLRDRCLGSGQEARAHAIGPRAKPQIDGGRLQLALLKADVGQKLTLCVDQPAQHMAGQNAGGVATIGLGFGVRKGLGHGRLIGAWPPARHRSRARIHRFCAKVGRPHPF